MIFMKFALRRPLTVDGDRDGRDGAVRPVTRDGTSGFLETLLRGDRRLEVQCHLT